MTWWADEFQSSMTAIIQPGNTQGITTQWCWALLVWTLCKKGTVLAALKGLLNINQAYVFLVCSYVQVHFEGYIVFSHVGTASLSTEKVCASTIWAYVTACWCIAACLLQVDSAHKEGPVVS